MNTYYCIVNLPGAPNREIAFFRAADDGSAVHEAERLAERWPGFETLTLHEGERLVTVLAAPDPDFPADSLALTAEAA